MADLMASLSAKTLSLTRGEEVEGEIVAITPNEAILDLGTKTEGLIGKNEFADEDFAALKVGNTIKAFVVVPENESNQTVLSFQKQTGRNDRRSQEQLKRWQKFIQAQTKRSTFSGKVTEVNKGGLVVEVDGIRGFVPSSQVGLESVAKVSSFEELIGQTLPVMVIEVDPGNNRLIFSARKSVTDEALAKLNEFEVGQKVKGQVSALVPFGLFVDLDGVEAVVFAHEVSWASSKGDEKEVANLAEQFEVGQEIEAVIIGKDENLGRLTLSIRQLQEDPFTKVAENFQTDDVVTGTVTAVDQNGVMVDLGEGVEGFVPAEKVETGSEYTAGQKTNFLVDNIDKARHRINLAPFLTSTVGLIYK
jgi:small subunit ribosomal protein S1